MSDAYGRVAARLPVFEPGVLAANLPRPGPATPYTRLGDWPGLLACLGIAVGALRALTVRARPA